MNCLVACVQINFGEFVTFANFAIFTACKGDSLVLFYILPHCLLTNWANMPCLPHLSNLSYLLPAKALLLADEFDNFWQICCCELFWTYLKYIIWHLFTSFTSFCYVSFAEDLLLIYRYLHIYIYIYFLNLNRINLESAQLWEEQ